MTGMRWVLETGKKCWFVGNRGDKKSYLYFLSGLEGS